MTENKLLAPCLVMLRTELARRAREQALVGPVILKHADSLTSGVPDVSITWRGRTSWWEFKHGPQVKWAHALQQLTCRRLAAAGTCHVVLYQEHDDRTRTCILTPDGLLIKEIEGFDHAFVVDHVWSVHA